MLGLTVKDKEGILKKNKGEFAQNIAHGAQGSDFGIRYGECGTKQREAKGELAESKEHDAWGIGEKL